MAFRNIKKAALLLTSLDPASAAELIKGVRAEVVTAIAAEVASARQGGRQTASAEPVREFAGMLTSGQQEESSFLSNVLESAMGKSQSQEILRQVKQAIRARDPFSQIRDADVKDIAKALEGESAQVISIVLSELPAKKSPPLLLLLEEKVRREAVREMTSGQDVPAEVRLRVAEGIRARLDSMGGPGQPQASSSEPSSDRREAQYRKVAVLLRGLEVPLRDMLLQNIAEADGEGKTKILKLMVTWEDVPAAADRAMQEILRTVDSRKLALALVEADGAIRQKIRSNMSDRASAMLDEEASLLSSPKADDIRSAREIVLDALRALNAKGELTFVET